MNTKSIKIRLDDLLVELGFFDSKEKARTCIMMNGVQIQARLENKAGKQINKKKFYEEFEKNSSYIQVDSKLLPYVSRGAFKLEAAYKKFDLDFHNKIILDIGASTGGFTDFCLQQGAKKVIALDVGKGQLHYRLQTDERVISLEETNFRQWHMQGIDFALDFVVCDVSFISVIVILERLKSLVNEYPDKFQKNLGLVFLLKPQFEAGKEIMDKCQGVIKDDKIREKVCLEVKQKIEQIGYQIQNQTQSPITGAKGNIEYLLKLKL